VTMRVVLLLIVVLFGASAAVEAVPEPLPLKATSKWHLNYADNYCRLGRQFGTGEDTVLLMFDKYAPEEAFSMTIVGKSMHANTDDGSLFIRFGPSEATQKLEFFSGSFGETNSLIIRGSNRVAPPTADEEKAIKKRRGEGWVELAPIAPDRYAAIRYLEVGKPLKKAVILETGALQQSFAALDQCVVDLMTRWGIDPKKHASLSRRVTPIGNPGQWITSNDYPQTMLVAGQRAIVDFRVLVGQDGKPTVCLIQATTTPKEFDDAVCKSLMHRARFLPALDSDGAPTASFWSNRVVFVMPRP
jgi:hypothetical protein